MTYQLKADILENKKVKGDYFHCQINAPAIAKAARPGQFVQVRVEECGGVLLRRPFSIHGVSGDKVRLFYEAVGKASGILSRKKAGQELDIIGPLGSGFSLLTTNDQRPTTILVAGGMGVAPLVFLAEKLKEIQNPKSKIQKLVLIGARAKSQVLCETEFKKLGYEVKIATDDGSRGFKGKVTDLLRHLLSTIGYRLSAIYSCGPRPMLKEVSRFALARNIPSQLSLEEHMACGIGACLGCAVNTTEGYQRVCKEGPVFAADKIIW